MTFNIMDTIAKEFLALVPNRQRSRLVSELIQQALEHKKENIIEACKKANKDGESTRLIEEWQGFDEPADGDWS
ncbi:MAG: hypothetical protein HY538_05495 [Deltaproteobacteria bacterium]|nr:hypothetical protein [Deltaproteobacteria bacterium]